MDERALLRKRILDWLDDNYLFGEAAALVADDDLSFLEHGILDSLGFVQLVLMLEKAYGVKIERRHLTRANFDSMNKILGYVTACPGFRA
jgi:acyl carrier protein